MTPRPLVFSPIVSVMVIMILLSVTCILAIFNKGGGGSVATLPTPVLTTYEFEGTFRNGTVRAKVANGYVYVKTAGAEEVEKTLGPENSTLFNQAIQEIFNTCGVEPVSQPPMDVAVFTRIIGTKRTYLHTEIIDRCPAARANINSVIIPLLDMSANSQDSEMIKMKYLP